VLLREPDALVVDQRRVFDRVGAGEDRILDRLRTVRVRRDFQAMGMRHVDDGLDLLGQHFALTRHTTKREHGAGRDDLEHVGTARDGLLGLLPELFGPARDTRAHRWRDFRFGMAGDDEVAAAGRDRQVKTATCMRGPTASPWLIASRRSRSTQAMYVPTSRAPVTRPAGLRGRCPVRSHPAPPACACNRR